MTLEEMFEAAEDDFLEFEKIENPRHPAPDICAFLMLYELAPSWGRGSNKPIDIVAGAGHDEIWLATDVEELEKVATPEIVRDLVRCGIRYDNDGLCMFV